MNETKLMKYGNAYYNNNEKARKTNIERFGYDSAMKNKKIAEKVQNTMIERYGEIWVKHVPAYNPNSIIYLDLISETLNIPIQHALNDGEKKFVRYWIDGYIKQYNICIEWMEKHHNQKKFIEKDLKKRQFLEDNFECEIIYVWQKEFLKDVDNQINIVIDKINNIINYTKNN
jgi:hypothetical protein